ncbi:hypothetical protein ACLB2K_048763 [Fragaria x ananassa]
MINLIAGGHENSVDLITVAEAIHWFDLPQFYSLVRRLLRKAGGVIAVWGYNHTVVSPDFDLLMKPLHKKMLPYYDPKTSYLWEGYRTLPFPFESVGLGREGEPMELDIKREQSFQGLVRFMRSCSAVTTAKDQGVDLLPEEVIEEMKRVWGGPDLVRSVTANAASGMAVHDDCKLRFLELKAKRSYRFILFKIEQQQIVVDKLGEPNDSYDDFTSSFPPDECRYAVYDFDFITEENCQKSKIFFIAWSPDPSKVRMKMVYASSKDRFKRELDGISFELQATDPSEMSLDIVKGRAC